MPSPSCRPCPRLERRDDRGSFQHDGQEAACCGCAIRATFDLLSPDRRRRERGLSRSHLYKKMLRGELEYRSHGKRRLVVVKSLRKLLGLDDS